METDDKIIRESKKAASIIADALVYSGLINKEQIDKAEEIIEEEILVRKSMGKL